MMPLRGGHASPAPSRRAVARALVGAGALAAFAGLKAHAGEGIPSCVVMDWGLAATVIALGIVPKGMPAPDWYGTYVVDPPRPPGVVDVGLLFTPNFELVQALAPDLIVVTPALESARVLFERIAPMLAVPLFARTSDPYEQALIQTLRLAEKLGRLQAGRELAERADATLARVRGALASYDGRPILLMSLIDDRHVSIFGAQSLFHGLLARMGLPDAGQVLVPRGELAVMGIEELAKVGDARVIHIDPPVQKDIALRVGRERMWQALPFVRGGRFQRIPTVLGTAGLPAAIRFADLIGGALVRTETDAG